MTGDVPIHLDLKPDHLDTLAAFGGGRVISAQLCRAGRFDPDGFALYGRLEVLANCGLVEFLARDGTRHSAAGDVVMYYYLTDRGRHLLRWRVGDRKAALNTRPASPRYVEAPSAAPLRT